MFGVPFDESGQNGQRAEFPERKIEQQNFGLFATISASRLSSAVTNPTTWYQRSSDDASASARSAGRRRRGWWLGGSRGFHLARQGGSDASPGTGLLSTSRVPPRIPRRSRIETTPMRDQRRVPAHRIRTVIGDHEASAAIIAGQFHPGAAHVCMSGDIAKRFLRDAIERETLGLRKGTVD